MVVARRAALLPVWLSACSLAPPAPVASGVALSASSAAPPLSEGCAQAARQRARVAGLASEGKLLRTLRVIEQADALCPEQRRASWVWQVEALAALGRASAARRLADEVASDGQSTDEDRRRAREAVALVDDMKRAWPQVQQDPPDAWPRHLAGVLQRGEAYAKDGQMAEAQRHFDRALDGLERLSISPTSMRIKWADSFSGAVAWSANGRRLAVAQMGDVLVLDPRTGEVLQRWEGDSLIRALAFAPGSDTLAIGRMDGQVAVLSLDGKSYQINDRAGPVYSLAYSPDGRWLAQGHDDGTVCVQGATQRACERRLQGHSARALALAFSPDGRRLFAGAERGMLSSWDIPEGTELFHLRLGDEPVRSLAVSADGKYLAAGASRVLVLDALNGALIDVRSEHREPVMGLAWEREGERLFSSSEDRSVRAHLFLCGVVPCAPWASAQGGTLAQWPPLLEESPPGPSFTNREPVTHPDLFARAGQAARMHGLALSPDGGLLTAATGETGVWLAPTGHNVLPWQLTVTPLTGAPSFVAMSGDGYIELSGPDSPRFEGSISCVIGDNRYPFSLCRERFLVPGLVARTLRGDTSYRMP